MIAASLPLARHLVSVAVTLISPWRGTPSVSFAPIGLRPRAASAGPLAPLGMRGARRPGVIYSVRSDLPTLTEVAPWERDVPVDEGARLAATVAELLAAAGERS